MQVRTVVGYTRVSTEEQSRNGTSLDGQREVIAAECRRRGWNLVEVREDASFSGKSLRRPGIRAALEAVESGRADTLIVSRLDRLTRSLRDFTALLERARREGWALTIMDADVDTSTAAGEAMANVIGVFAQFERRRIGERTAEGIAKRRAAGQRWGRERAVPAKVAARIRRLRSRGWSYPRIADRLNQEGVATGHGGRKWWPSTVRSVAMQKPEQRRKRSEP
jgi:DNA invertase Pin-like site-specific DNA recombinase